MRKQLLSKGGSKDERATEDTMATTIIYSSLLNFEILFNKTDAQTTQQLPFEASANE